MKASQCAAHNNWKTPQLPSVLSLVGADVVKTITSLLFLLILEIDVIGHVVLKEKVFMKYIPIL